jgi:hypothetical protein
MAFESKDNLYVFDIQNNRIQVLNSSTYIKNGGKKDIEDDEFFLVQNVVNDNKVTYMLLIAVIHNLLK